ncbi:amidohydrolase family protein [Paenibacillus agaridevorans]|uniref:amidohydrolase family protein n=1 Tax=Paenibacillus agaridevorans TaxID=171404 RepID=UPI002484AF5A|nr:amidohydrolase family protein [Paenibacillus agaridevorans]
MCADKTRCTYRGAWGADNNIMFSSDYPHWDFDNPRVVLQPIRKELRQKILSENAMNLYRLFERKQTTLSTGIVREAERWRRQSKK